MPAFSRVGRAGWQRSRHRLLALAVASVAIFSAGTFVSAAPDDDSDRALLKAPIAVKTTGDDPTRASLTQAPDSASVRIVGVDADAVDAGTETLRIDLAADARITAVRTEYRIGGQGTGEWHGQLTSSIQRPDSAREVGSDELNSVVLVRNGNRVTGTIRVDGQLYRLVPLSRGDHALVMVDERRTPPGGQTPRSPAAKWPEPASTPEVTATQTVRVLVAVSNNAQREIGDLQGLVNLAISESNRGFANSQVPVFFELAGVHRTTYDEVGGADHLGRLQKTGDGFMDEVHAVRNSTGADVVAMLVVEPSYCGLGYLNAPATFAFSTVNWRCATGNYTFAHEIGHNFGATHDTANSNNATYPYGHGYQYQPGTTSDWRTIMAYECPGGCPRLNYWSNPRVTYNGAPMGTTASHDNARLLGERAATVAGFRPPISVGERYEVGVWRSSEGRFHLRDHNGQLFYVGWGGSGDVPVTGDWNGDGRFEVGVWRPSEGRFHLRDHNGQLFYVSWGGSGDIPVTGDWNGDGRFEVGIWRPSEGRFHLRDHNGQLFYVSWGGSGDIPVTGDWNGDGRFEVGIWRPSEGRFHLRDHNGQLFHVDWGQAGDVPVTADWNGN